jgi:CubicO group peptidase (beta-lactamase class C family)
MAATADQSDPGLWGDLETYVRETMGLLDPSAAAIVVSRGDELLYEQYLGGNWEGLPRTEITADSLFALASCTKSFSTGVLLALVQEGTVGLDDPVSRYLPAFREPGPGLFSREAVTLRHLASHTSGLHFADDRWDGPYEELQVETKPGGEFWYSFVGLRVLQEVLEKASGQDFETLMRQKVTVPLGLEQTRYVYRPDPELSLVPARAGDFATDEEHYSWSRLNYHMGSGLWSTARDVNRYSQHWARRSAETRRLYGTAGMAEALQTWGTMKANGANYGLLWWVFPEQGAAVMSGATHSVSVVLPESQVALTVLRNYFGELPEGFVYHEDKQRLVDFARRVGNQPAP